MDETLIDSLNEWKKPSMNVLFICTSNKDRSPALEKYFKKVYPKHNYKSAGVNKYFCGKKETTYLTSELLDEADIIIFAEDVHLKITKRDFKDCIIKPTSSTWIKCLNLGEYEQGNINDEYLTRADEKIGWALK